MKKSTRAFATFLFFVVIGGVLIWGNSEPGEKSESLTATSSQRHIAAVESSIATKPVLPKAGQLSYRADEALSLMMNEWIQTGSSDHRRALLEKAKKDPVVYIRLVRKLLKDMPVDKVIQRRQILSLTIDVADFVKADELVNGKNFFYEARSIAIDEISIPEFVRSPSIETMTQMQKDSLLHYGDLIVRDGEVLQVTIEPKVLALHMTGRFPDQADKLLVSNALKTAKMEPFTRRTLDMTLKMYAQ